jgi:hypothetical protein
MTVEKRRPWADDDGLAINVGRTTMHYDPKLKHAGITVVCSDANLRDIETCIKELREYLGLAS